MEETGSPLRPVAAIGPGRLNVVTAGRQLVMPLFANRPDWNSPDAGLTHAVIVLHGRQRNADDYLRVAIEAAAGAAGLIIAPQFLALPDTQAHPVDPALLRWEGSEWMGGADAAAPAPVSGFAVLDELVTQLRDKTRYPLLRKIVIAAHSGGGQVAQRYAILSPQADGIRFIIANPSSYAYFTPDRISGEETIIPDPLEYPGYDDWKYGMRDRPAYSAAVTAAELEQRYLTRDITYVLGQADCDPAHPALDLTPAAQAQGQNRLERGRRYHRYLQLRHGAALHHALIEVPNVGHDPMGIFSAPRVRTLLFNDKNKMEESNEYHGGTRRHD